MDLKIKDWSNINIKIFEKIKAIKTDDVYFANCELLAILCDVSVDGIANLEVDEFNKLLDETKFLNNAPKPQFDGKLKYLINGKKYELTPSANKFTVAQYADYESYLKNNASYANILSCLLIPEKHKYNDGYDIEEVINDIKTLPIAQALGISSFFFLVFKSLSIATLESSEKALKKELKRAKTEEEKKRLEKGLTALKDSKKAIAKHIIY